jgi:hypothetical protein
MTAVLPSRQQSAHFFETLASLGHSNGQITPLKLHGLLMAAVHESTGGVSAGQLADMLDVTVPHATNLLTAITPAVKFRAPQLDWCVRYRDKGHYHYQPFHPR